MDYKITIAFLEVLYRELQSIYSATVRADAPFELQNKLSLSMNFLLKAIEFLTKLTNA